VACSFEDKKLTVNHIPGPEGVRGRNSDNTLIKEKLGWAPNIPLTVGLRKTYDWIKKQIEAEVCHCPAIPYLTLPTIVIFLPFIQYIH
jgi:GDP-D-mannose 3',5'-epimerase